MLDSPKFREYMSWVGEGVVFFVRPHASLLKEDGIRAGVTWDSVIRIDGMVKLLLEQYRVAYLPIDTPNMQERVRAIEYVLHRQGLRKSETVARELIQVPRLVTMPET